MADMAALLFGDCLENMEMDGVRCKDLRGFKGYSFHEFLPLHRITRFQDTTAGVPGTGHHILVSCMT
jgi:hypothetical protein